MKLYVIGSGSNAHLKCKSQFVSTYHAEILLLDNGEILLTDKGSKNGTYLNEQRLQPNKDIPVRRGDSIRFADYVLNWKDIPEIEAPDMSTIKEMRGIGTNFRNKHQLQGDMVSRFHATLKRKNDKKWYIQDHSKNGTTVNGQRIPSDQDVRLKKGDKILCAGVPVPNPYGNAPSFNFRKLIQILSLIIFLCGGTYGVMRLVRNATGNKAPKARKTTAIFNSGRKMTDEQIYEKYQSSVVLIYGRYYYKVSAGSLNLKKSGLPVEVVLGPKGNVIGINGDVSKMNTFTGTGFFISQDGKVATNLHVAQPWVSDQEISKIKEQYMKLFANAADALEDASFNYYMTQISVEGVMDYIGVIPNGEYFSGSNLLKCRTAVVPDNPAKDVAILQLESRRLPSKSTYVNLDKVAANDSEIKVGTHVCTLGFPFGLGLQDIEANVLNLSMNPGSITQEAGEYTFGFNAPSFGGASGSPVFNEKGKLVGVLNSGVPTSQGFNFAVKASHLTELMNQVEKK